MKKTYLIGSIVEQGLLSKMKAALAGATEAQIDIDSVGGDVREGKAIRAYLQSLGVPVTTRVVGVCYSIASIVLQGGSRRVMQNGTEVMIHNAWFDGVRGNKEELRLAADYLQEVDESMALMYTAASNGKLSEAVAKSLMEKETYITPEQALAYGLIDEVEEEAAATYQRGKAVAMYNFNEQKNQVMEDLSKIKAALTAFAKFFAPDGGAKGAQYTLADGTTVIEAESLAEGSATSAPDGTHALADGTIIEVAGGMITSVSAPKSAADDDEMVKMKAAFEQQIADMKAENEAMKEEMRKKDEGYAAAAAAFKEAEPIMQALLKAQADKPNKNAQNNGGAEPVEKPFDPFVHRFSNRKK